MHPDRGLKIVYPGLIKPERLEVQLLLALGQLENVALDIYGIEGAGGYQQELLAAIKAYSIRNVSFKGAYTSGNIGGLLQEYHFALFPYPVTYANVDFCLPNKFFQCIEATLPLITTDMKEMGGLVKRHHLGHVFPSRDYDSLRRICSEAAIDSEAHAQFVRNVYRYGTEVVNYPNQQRAMLEVYAAAVKGG